jgi:hypothetical protein
MNNEEQDQDFGKLQHLLKLKRYEQPHPRYFSGFSGQVLSRIRANRSTSRSGAVREFVSRTPWLRRLWRAIEAQPAVSGTVATVACGLMVTGAFFMEATTPPSLNAVALDQGNGDRNNLAPAPALGGNFATTEPQLVTSSTNLSPLPTGPVATGLNLFQRQIEVMPAASGTSLLQK